VGRFLVGVVHGDGPGGTTFSRAAGTFTGERVDCVVFGHSHQPLQERRGQVLYLNPGSPTDRRREPRFSFAWLRPAETLVAEHVFFESKT
jgi:predicted phosphodiesterase